MWYLVSFLGGIVSWNAWESKLEAGESQPIVKLATNGILLFLAYKLIKKIN